MKCLTCGKETGKNEKYCSDICHLRLISLKLSNKLSIAQIDRLAALEGKSYGRYVLENKI